MYTVNTKFSVIDVTKVFESLEYFYVMKTLGIETWKQRVFYGFIFIVGYFYQPNWFYMNFYSNPKFRDDASWVPSFAVYSALSGLLTAVTVWAFIRFAKKFL
jgi:hypothetical protein